MRNKILDTARAEIGQKENPLGSNRTKYGQWYENGKWDGYSWCAMFVSWVYAKAGSPLPKIDDGMGFRYCPTLFHRATQYGWKTSKPIQGDIVLFDWGKDGQADHTGIFVRDIGKGMFECIEGNTSYANQSNGDGVMLRERSYNSVQAFINVLDKVAEQTEWKIGDKGPKVREIQRKLNIAADGDFGPATHAAVVAFQKSKGLVPDGVVGPKTLKALG